MDSAPPERRIGRPGLNKIATRLRLDGAARRYGLLGLCFGVGMGTACTRSGDAPARAVATPEAPRAETPRAETPRTETPRAEAALSAVAAPASVAPTSEGDCTLATPLVPGAPGSPGNLIRSERNPNGQSELAAHMRKMQADLQAAREAVRRGEHPTLLRDRHRRIRCSWPTTPSDRDERFDGFAQSYLGAVAALDAAPAAGAAAAYERVIDACRACHEQTCSGVLVAIEGLRLKAKTAAP